jgi:hypothetical protein
MYIQMNVTTAEFKRKYDMMRQCQTEKEKLAQYFSTLVNAVTPSPPPPHRPTNGKRRGVVIYKLISLKHRQNYIASIVQPRNLVILNNFSQTGFNSQQKTSPRLCLYADYNQSQYYLEIR